MTQPCLSICIATYNRACYIAQTLDSIIPQLEDDVELLVVDGASIDNTEAVVKEYAKGESRIRYIRLYAKGGVDHDYDKAVEAARGEFCWLFTDDDLLKPGAVSAVKAAIKEGYGLIVVNAEVRDRSLLNIIERQRIVVQDNQVFPPDDTERFFVLTLNYLSFIGAVVIRRSIWLSRDRSLYFGTEFVHVGVIFQRPLSESILVIADPYISIRYENAQWTSRSFDIWLFKWPKLVWSFKHISEQAKLRITRQEPWRRLRALIVHRARGVYNNHLYNDRFSMQKVSKLWKVGAWLISHLPPGIFAGPLYYYCRLTRSDALLLFDLRPKSK